MDQRPPTAVLGAARTLRSEKPQKDRRGGIRVASAVKAAPARLLQPEEPGEPPELLSEYLYDDEVTHDQQQQKQKQQNGRALSSPGRDGAKPHGPGSIVGGAASHDADKTEGDENTSQEQGPSANPAAAVPAPRVPVLTVGLMTLAMSACGGLGALPYFFIGKLSPAWAGLANAVACGVMLAASFDLIHEGAPHGQALVIAGILLGALFVRACGAALGGGGADGGDGDGGEAAALLHSFEELRGADARKVVVFLCVMCAHALGEGFGVGVSFAGQRGWVHGTLVTLAIAAHNIPEGLAVATVMAAKGAKPGRALLWSVLTQMPQALVAVPAYMFAATFRTLLPLAVGFAAGCMMWIVFAELLPDALEAADHGHVATAATFSAAGLQALGMMLANLEQPNGTLSSPVQADVPLLLPVVISLLPAAVMPGLVAAALARSPLSRPAALGLSAGIQFALGLGGLAHVTGGSAPRQGAQLLLCAGGAGAVALAWHLLNRHQGPLFVPDGQRSSSSGCSMVKKQDEPPAKSRLLRTTTWHDDNYPADAGAFVGNGSSSNGNLVQVAHVLDTPVKHGRDESPSRHGGVLEQRAKVHIAVAASASSSRMAESDAPGLPITTLPGGAAARPHGCSAPEEQLQLRAAAVGACAMCVYAVPYGMTIASAALQDIDRPMRLILPTSLLGMALGACCAGAARLLSGSSAQLRLLLVTGLSSLGPLWALVSLAAMPLGQAGGWEADFDPTDATSKLQAVAAGAMLATSILIVWPRAKALHQRRGDFGMMLGLVLGLGTLGVCGTLCIITSSCLHNTS